ncbi:IclR family transcriptional regulator [Halobellus ruber]|uniref:IclR family transcriptional regulator n=1 Tax=Halobellus ruber TaxID=2761102 RepID=A0A7J9SGS6_9EURY|nr:IclR family transcriptional regulator [Halobellus ruber]MBB6646164.1 IclR family transcriptional regulator [Halobellus ruber]
MAGNQGPEPGTVGATETSFAILSYLKEQSGANVTEIATGLDLSKSTVYNHLRTLNRLGYVAKEDKRYHLGLKFLDLGNAARDRQDLYEVAKGEIDDLVSTIGEHGYVMVEEMGRGVYIYQSKTARGIQTDSHIGTTVDLHATAVGKAYLAHLPEDRRASILDDLDLPSRTESTYTDRDRLEAELEAVRRQGVAFNNEERFVGLRAVGAPVLGPDDEVLAAISISGPTTRLTGDRYRSEIPEKVRETARIIGIRATYS